jgi:iron complex transport system ATP-binding protein
MILHMVNVSWKRKNEEILRDISWDIHAGEHWCLVGLNGSGKTTLLNMMNGYIWPTEGSISVLGHTYGKINIPEFRKRIGWVSSSLQQKFYGHETAEEIVLSGKFATIGLHEHVKEEDIKQAVRLIEEFGCGKLIGREFATLSQGEQQKIQIARSLMAAPDVLILDEPCTGLDILAREQVLMMIQSITSQQQPPTLIYVTHHIEEILPCFTHTLLLKNGEVYKSGETEEILTAETLSDFFEAPIEVRQQGERNWVSLNLE